MINAWEPGFSLTGDYFEASFKRFSQLDDVFDLAFQKGLVIVQAQDTSNIELSVPAGLNAHIHTAKTPRVAAGPYFVKGNSLHQVWRLYPDNLESFITATIPDNHVPYK